MQNSAKLSTVREPEEPGELSERRNGRQAEGQPVLSRRQRRKIATRAALLNAAEQVIAIKGVYLAVIEEITERADVAKGLFYQYFRDRDDLLHALLVRRLNDLRNVIDAVPVEGTVVDRVGTMIGHHLDYFLRHEDFLLFLHQIRGLIKMKKDEVSGVRETYRDHILFVAEALFPDALKVPAKKKMAEEIACSLLGLLTGFLSHYVIIGSLKNLVVDRERIGQALTQACLGFVREYNGVLATARKGAHSASTGTPAA